MSPFSSSQPHPQTPPPPKEIRFNFYGHANIVERYEYEQIVLKLNKQSSEIGQEIKSIITSAFPTATEVKVDINYSKGSVEWLGVVFIVIYSLDWMSRISGSIDFIEKASKTVKASIDYVNRKRIGEFGEVDIRSYETIIFPPIESYPKDPFLYTLEESVKVQQSQNRLLREAILQMNGLVRSVKQARYMNVAILILVIILLAIQLSR